MGSNVLVVEESDKNWAIYNEVLRGLKTLDITHTTFTKKDLKAASLIRVHSSAHKGYPQPEDNFEYLDQVYDTSNVCRSCKLGLGSQVESFRLKSEPKWGKKELFSLNWVHDELFVTPDFYRQVFGPMGLEKRAVIHHKSGKPLETVVQLCIPEVDIPFDMPPHAKTETCNVCNQTKYQGWTMGFLPPLKAPVKLDIFKPSTIFGSGGSSFKQILISSSFYADLVKRGTKGFSYYEVEAS